MQLERKKIVLSAHPAGVVSSCARAACSPVTHPNNSCIRGGWSCSDSRLYINYFLKYNFKKGHAMQKEMLNNVEEFMPATFRYSLELQKQYSQYYYRSKAIC